MTQPSDFMKTEKQEIEGILKKINEKEKAEQIDTQFKKISGDEEFQKLMELSKQNYKRTLYNQFHIFINKEKKLHGKIVNQLFPYKKKISLAKTIYNEDDENKIIFFHEKMPKGFKVGSTLSVEFFIYLLLAEDKQYYIFSDKELNTEEYFLQGSLINPNDFEEMGKKFKLSTKLDILIVHTAKPRIIKYENNEEFFQAVAKYDLSFDKFNNWLFSCKDKRYKNMSMRHPELFEWLFGAFLFSADYDGYPLHLFIIAHAGSGKTTLEECTHEKFQEFSDVCEGSGSTVKSLVPSFKGNLPKAGYMIQSNRICVIDEFLRILLRVRPEEREQQLSMLNPLLEHRKRMFSSGNSEMEGNMTSKMLAVSNAIWGTNEITQLSRKFDNSFLSRLFIWYQDPEHIQWVKDKCGLEPHSFDIDLNDWLSTYDYLNSFRAKYDKTKVTDMGKMYTQILEKDGGSEIVKAEIYQSRYINHHFHCIIDGLIKYRCLIEKDQKFTAKQEDYQKLKEITELLIENWFKFGDNWQETFKNGSKTQEIEVKNEGSK